MNLLYFFDNIFYSLQIFFFVNTPFAHVFRVILIAQIAFLIFTSFRPSKWKWIVLFATELFFLLGGFVVICQDFAGNAFFSIGYGVIVIHLAFVMFFITLWCSLRKA